MTLAALSGAAPAQEQYRLDEADTWELVDQAEPGTPEGQLAVARKALAAGQHERAEHLATLWIDHHEHHPLMPEAYLVRADSLFARRSYYQALYDYEFVARMYPGSETFTTALQRELDIAKLFATGTKRKFWGMRIAGADDEAEELLIRIQERLPGSRLAEEAGIMLGDFYFSRSRMFLAGEMYEIFLENYPDSEYTEKARKRLIYANLASFKGPEFDATGLYDARARLQALQAIDPVSAQEIGATALLTRIDDSDARKLLTTARWYLKTNDAISAELFIRRLVETYPDTAAAREAMRMIDTLLPRLPQSVIDDAPDYAALKAGILGQPLPTDEPPDTPDTPEDEEASP